MLTKLLCLDAFDALHIFPPDVFLSFETKNGYHGFHVPCIIMHLEELLHSKQPLSFHLLVSSSLHQMQEAWLS